MEKLYNPNINDWQKYKFKFLDKHMDSANERRFFKFYISRNSQKKHIGWDIPWIYKLILNNKKTIVPNFNLIKNVGYKYDPSGKGAKKFRELKLNKFINFDKIPKEIEHNYSYDDFLRKNFYLRENIFILVYRKLKKIFNEIF